MAGHVELGATARCQFGTVPSELRVDESRPLASAGDYRPYQNIQPFGMCICPGNPAVASASAVVGTLTPAPCVPAVDEPWLPGSSRLTVAGVPGLGPDASARCRWGGLIQLVQPRKARSHG